jgi:hypothetical protein
MADTAMADTAVAPATPSAATVVLILGISGLLSVE